jgi:hypothetical protein
MSGAPDPAPAPDRVPGTPTSPRTLWLTQVPRPVAKDDIGIVLDAAWTPDAETAAAGRLLPVRDDVARLFAWFDPITETSTALDAWAVASGVVEALTIGETSIWYNRRLRHWLWLQERVVWAHLLRSLLDEHHPTAIVCGPGTDEALVDVARLMAAAGGLPIRLEGEPVPSDVAEPDDATGAPATPDDSAPSDEPAPDGASSLAARPTVVAAAAAGPGRRSPIARLVARIRRVLGGGRAPAKASVAEVRRQEVLRMNALLEERLARLAAEEGGRLLVVLNHHAQRIETPAGPRMLNPYLGSVADRLAGTVLDPILLDWRLKGSRRPAWDRLRAPGAERLLSQDAVHLGDAAADPTSAERAALTSARIRALRVPIPMCGIDLGPALAEHVGGTAERWMPGKERAVARLGRLIARLHPAGILIADEYHRQDWMEAARAAGVPLFAIQHGTIYHHHNGYIHAERPPQLRLPRRTYVYGRWERDLLLHGSVYRDDEVMAGGSPRLDLYRPDAVDRDAARAELGVAPGDRVLVLSGTYGAIYRRFHYPVVLARVFDRPHPGIHLVVKQHPAEADEGPYRAVVEGVARARGFAPPPITVVRDVDLYRLLRAADAHLGIHSTVLTEAVFVGTPNLLATSVVGGDLLDYVASGVALPVVDGGDLAAAMDAAASGAITAEARAAFIASHYEPGSATERIASDLLGLLAAGA